jgi:hypothetical protein
MPTGDNTRPHGDYKTATIVDMATNVEEMERVCVLHGIPLH